MQKIISILTFGIISPETSQNQGRNRSGQKKTNRPQSQRREQTQRRDQEPKRREDRPKREPKPQADKKPQDRDRDRRPKREPEQTPVTNERIYVGNLDYEVTEADLYDLFGGCGTVRDAEVVCHRYTQRSKGYAFVEMGALAEAKRAAEKLHNEEFMGRQLWISGAKSDGPRHSSADDAENSKADNDDEVIEKPVDNDEEK